MLELLLAGRREDVRHVAVDGDLAVPTLERGNPQTLTPL